MSRPPYHFRGIPEFIEAAAHRAGRPDLSGSARRIEALTTLSSLCSQAVEAGMDGDRAAAILRQATDFRDQLRIAFEAADAMLSAVALGCEAGPSAVDGLRPLDPTPRKRPRRRGRPDPDQGTPQGA